MRSFGFWHLDADFSFWALRVCDMMEFALLDTENTSLHTADVGTISFLAASACFAGVGFSFFRTVSLGFRVVANFRLGIWWWTTRQLSFWLEERLKRFTDHLGFWLAIVAMELAQVVIQSSILWFCSTFSWSSVWAINADTFLFRLRTGSEVRFMSHDFGNWFGKTLHWWIHRCCCVRACWFVGITACWNVEFVIRLLIFCGYDFIAAWFCLSSVPSFVDFCGISCTRPAVYAAVLIGFHGLHLIIGTWIFLICGLPFEVLCRRVVSRLRLDLLAFSRYRVVADLYNGIFFWAWSMISLLFWLWCFSLSDSHGDFILHSKFSLWVFVANLCHTRLIVRIGHFWVMLLLVAILSLESIWLLFRWFLRKGNF